MRYTKLLKLIMNDQLQSPEFSLRQVTLLEDQPYLRHYTTWSGHIYTGTKREIMFQFTDNLLNKIQEKYINTLDRITVTEQLPMHETTQDIEYTLEKTSNFENMVDKKMRIWNRRHHNLLIQQQQQHIQQQHQQHNQRNQA